LLEADEGEESVGKIPLPANCRVGGKVLTSPMFASSCCCHGMISERVRKLLE
jgi:hypothetical protein